MTELAIVGIGASAGGLETIREMLKTADADAAVAYVVVQHLDPNHESMMAELLEPHTDLKVTQALDGELVDAGHVYIIPPGHGLEIADRTLSLTAFREPRGLRRPIDDFFVSLASAQGDNAICVILSGTGADGSSGLRAVKENGGLSVVQDPETAKYDGMPLAAVGTGLVDFVKPPSEIVPTIMAFLEQKIRDTEAKEAADKIAAHVDDICSSLSAVVGHDFSGYKRSTITRRIQRRMQVLGIVDGGAYLDHIRQDDDECQTLLRELLINVTRFFRDTEQFEEMRRTVIVPLVARNRGEEIRVWVPGCSSGEEAYSIAMYFASEIRKAGKSILVQIFATDIDTQMLSTARAGIYPSSMLVDIPAEMRESFTVGRDGSFQVAPVIRDMIRFSDHNLVKDPPFSRLDLISCRNLLIYFGDRLQAQALPIFHYSLKPGGHLFLGPSESIGRHENLFSVVDQKARLYRRGEGRPVYPLELTASSGRSVPLTGGADQPARVRHSDWDESYATDRILENYAPPTLRVTREGEILKSSGQFARYLTVSPTRTGPAHVQAMARQGLREVLPTLLREGFESRRRKIVRSVRVVSDTGAQMVDVVADPLPDETMLLVLIERGSFEQFSDEEYDEIREFDSHEHIVEEELRITRLRLRSAVEELETANEELKSSNEEMMSMNEELQSTNEELSTVNDELKSKVDELSLAHDDLENLFTSIDIVMVVVDEDLTIRRFSDTASQVFMLRPGDSGRRLTDLRTHLQNDDEIVARTLEVIETETAFEDISLSREDDTQWSMTITPYRTENGRVSGAVLSFVDVSHALSLERALQDETARLKLALEVANIGFWQYDFRTGETVLDESAQRLFGVVEETSRQAENLFALIPDEDQVVVHRSLRDAIEGRADYEATFRVRLPNGSFRHLKGLGRRVSDHGFERIVGVNFDQTSDVEADMMRDTMIREINHRIKNLFSIMSALVRLGARSATDIDELSRALTERISALSRSHDLSTRQNAISLTLREILETAVEPYDSGKRVTISGPEVEIDPDHLTALGLIFHEWATNSAKYGALGAEDGRLEISWNRNEASKVALVWSETSTVIAPRKGMQSGFGSQLVTLSLTQIDGKADVAHDAGVRRIDLEFKPD